MRSTQRLFYVGQRMLPLCPFNMFSVKFCVLPLGPCTCCLYACKLHSKFFPLPHHNTYSSICPVMKLCASIYFSSILKCHTYSKSLLYELASKTRTQFTRNLAFKLFSSWQWLTCLSENITYLEYFEGTVLKKHVSSIGWTTELSFKCLKKGQKDTLLQKACNLHLTNIWVEIHSMNIFCKFSFY